MNILLNGAAYTVQSPGSIADLIEHLGYTGKRIALERNGDIVPRSQYLETLLHENDKIEIVVAVGGG